MASRISSILYFFSSVYQYAPSCDFIPIYYCGMPNYQRYCVPEGLCRTLMDPETDSFFKSVYATTNSETAKNGLANTGSMWDSGVTDDTVVQYTVELEFNSDYAVQEFSLNVVGVAFFEVKVTTRTYNMPQTVDGGTVSS